MQELINNIARVPLLLPLVIILLRTTDVSLGTIRMIFVVRGKRIQAAILGFFEVIIWLTAVSGIITHIGNWLNVVAWGFGFALGNIVGMHIENKMALGAQVVRFISTDQASKITRFLRSSSFGVTEIVASGRDGPLDLGLVIAKRKEVPEVVNKIRECDPEAVITIEDVRHSNVADYRKAIIGTGWRAIFKKK